MKHDVLAIAGCRQKTVEPPGTADGLTDKPLRNCAKGDRFQGCLDLSCLTRFLKLGLVVEPHIQRGQSGWGVPQGVTLGDTGSQNKLVGNGVHAPRRQ